MFTHAPRVTRCYADVSGRLHKWSDRAAVVLICQHDADEKVKATHVHLGLWGVDVKAEALKREFNDGLERKLSGNEDWKWKSKRFPAGLPAWEEIVLVEGHIDPTNKAQYENYKYIRYCIKGDLSRVKFVKNISPAILEAAAADWAVPVEERNPVEVSERQPKPPPYQQLVIADAAERWYAEKRNGHVEPKIITKFICDAMRKHGRGINPHMVRDLTYAVLYDDLDYKDLILAKVQKFL